MRHKNNIEKTDDEPRQRLESQMRRPIEERKERESKRSDVPCRQIREMKPPTGFTQQREGINAKCAVCFVKQNKKTK